MPQYELNIRDYLRIFRKRQLIIVVTFAISLGWSYAFLSMQKPVYQASTTVKILERKNIAGLLTEWIVYDPGNIMDSQTKIITGYPVLRKVALRMGVVSDDTPAENVDRIIIGLQGKITAERVGSTNIIRITTTADSAKGAMDLANTVAEIYVAENLAEKRKQSSAARHFIEEQLAQLEERLQSGEENLKNYNREVTDIKLIEPFQEQLVSLEFELASLLQKYTDKHPRVVQLKEQKQELEKQLRGLSSQDLQYAGLLREVEVNKKLYAMLKEKLEEARITEAQKVEDVSIVDPAVFPLAPVSAQNELRLLISGLGGLILGIALAFIRETMDTSVGTIEDVEKLIKLPILGVVPSTERYMTEKAGVINFWKRRIFAKKEDLPDERHIRLILHYDSTSPIAEAYRNIRTNLQLAPEHKTILVTSAGPREGKSTIIMNLGLAFAQKGLKTVLVSSDLRRPVIAKTFGIRREIGINEVITGAASLDQALQDVTDMMMGDMPLDDVIKSPALGNISILSCGHLVFNPSELLESKELPKLIDELKKRFDLILFDSPPVLSIADASLLAPKVDCVILCYEIGKTSRQALLRAKNQLEMVSANIIGVILNHITAQSETMEAYPYYGKYSYTSEKEEHKPVEA
jgi:polysaccharide biosynthesis transport protein